MDLKTVKYNMLKPVKWRNVEWILAEYIYWIDEREFKVRHSVTLVDVKTGRCHCRANLEDVEVINNG